MISENAMKLPRRKFLHLAAGAAALPAVSRVARAQSYPSRPVRIIVAAAAAGPTDIIGRVMGQWLSERLGQQFFVENRAGGGNNIGTEAVVRAPADGYTLLLSNAVNAVNASLYDKLNYDFLRDTTPIAGIARTPLVLEVHPSVPAKTVLEFIAYAKANPRKLNMASGGNGSSGHVSGELFKMMTGTEMIHVPYRGSGVALTDLLGGQVQVLFDPIPSSIEHIRAGKLRPLAVTTIARWEGLPDIPALADYIPGYEASAWYGVSAPKNTPEEVIIKLNREINAGLADPKFKARLADMSATPLLGSSADYGRLIVAETEKWGKVIRAGNIKAD
jgi:tripartite-type tricarboxylate transporter receptor subunit TctC